MEIKRGGIHKIVSKADYELKWKALGYEIVEEEKKTERKKRQTSK